MEHPAESDVPQIVRVLGLALDEFDQMHEYPVETDDGMVMRCACGATPPSHLLGQQVDESLWLWEHWRAERRTHVAAALAAAGIGVLAAAKAEALLPIRRFSEAGAVSAKALGQNDRHFLDLLILCDRVESEASR